MKAQDLRIGNFIQSRNYSNDNDYVWREWEVRPDDIPAIFESTLIDQYRGIPLTEEWLLKFSKITWLSKDIDGYFYWFNGEKKYLKFLHSLQNVYFDIENKELEWSDTKKQNT